MRLFSYILEYTYIVLTFKNYLILQIWERDFTCSTFKAEWWRNDGFTFLLSWTMLASKINYSFY